MSCTTDKFVINKGMNNEFIITIKQNDSTIPMIIAPTDTFKVKLYKLDTNTAVTSLSLGDGVAVTDANNGQITITFDSTFVDTLETKRGSEADRYYLKPMYRLAIDCVTVNNGTFVAKISDVYVEA